MRDHLVAEQTKSYNIRAVNEYQIFRAEVLAQELVHFTDPL
jgi:hypothetical protein